jgi:hypothetical protein
MNRKPQNFAKRQKTNWVAQLSPLYTALKDGSVRWQKIQSRLHGSNEFNRGGGEKKIRIENLLIVLAKSRQNQMLPTEFQQY